jgi:hypothetical protein
MLWSAIGSFRSLKEFRPVLTLEMIEVLSSLSAYTVRRSALNKEQMSCDSSSMISSMFEVAWILLVTACRFLKKASRLPSSPALAGSAAPAPWAEA